MHSFMHNLVSSILITITKVSIYTPYVHCVCSDEPPKLTSQPENLSKVAPGTAALFAVQATGTDPLNFHWQWKPAEECESEEWQPCDAEWSDGATLTIPSVQKPNEGSYCCVISNCAGTQTSSPAQLTVGKNPLKLISTVYT